MGAIVARATSLASEAMLMILPPRPRADHALRRLAPTGMRREMDLDHPAPFVVLRSTIGLPKLNTGVVTRMSISTPAASKCSERCDDAPLSATSKGRVRSHGRFRKKTWRHSSAFARRDR